MERRRVPLADWLGCSNFVDNFAASNLFQYIEQVSAKDCTGSRCWTDPTSSSFFLWESAEERHRRREDDQSRAKAMSDSGQPRVAAEGQIQSHDGRWMAPTCWRWLSDGGHDPDITARVSTEAGKTMLKLAKGSVDIDIEVRTLGTHRDPKEEGAMYTWEPCSEADVSDLVPSCSEKGGKWILRDINTFEAHPGACFYWCSYIPQEYKFVGYIDYQKAETETTSSNSLTLTIR